MDLEVRLLIRSRPIGVEPDWAGEICEIARLIVVGTGRRNVSF
jgi:hypothetical protein